MKGEITTDLPPAVTITTPQNGATVLTPVTFAGASSDEGHVVAVVVSWQATPFNVSQLGGTAAASCPCDGSWTASAVLLPGRYLVQATATDDVGQTTTTPQISITV
jgi:hypothetical protein